MQEGVLDGQRSLCMPLLRDTAERMQGPNSKTTTYNPLLSWTAPTSSDDKEGESHLQKHQVLTHLLRDAVYNSGAPPNATLGRETRPTSKIMGIHCESKTGEQMRKRCMTEQLDS